jgi:NAD-dependent deacetylase
LHNAGNIAVLTGAGISAESGIPTFRSAGGLWRNFRPEELATPEAFDRDPATVWEWYLWRRELIAQAQPNAGHFALVKLEERTPHSTLITQNVDGLHDQAGSRRILKVHGDIWINRCRNCGRETGVLPAERLPRCACGGILRPGVVWFGEALPRDVWLEAEKATSEADVLLVVGTSAQVYPAAGLVPYAQSNGAAVIEVNLEATPFSESVDYCLRGPAGEILPQIIASLQTTKDDGLPTVGLTASCV